MIKLSQIRTACALKTEYVAVVNKKSSKPLTPGNKESNARRIHRQILKGSTMVHNSEAKIFDNKNQIIQSAGYKDNQQACSHHYGDGFNRLEVLVLSNARPCPTISGSHLLQHMFRVWNLRDSDPLSERDMQPIYSTKGTRSLHTDHAAAWSLSCRRMMEQGEGGAGGSPMDDQKGSSSDWSQAAQSAQELAKS